MTESAKQDTKKTSAEPAATESAATTGEAAQETPAEAAEAAEATAAAAGESAEPDDLDETKRKFREALERKHQAHNEGQGKGGRDGGKISGAHGPAASRRNFRRKSG
ncbi:MAG: DUF5302 domain-containing protein [Trebonia sp.]